MALEAFGIALMDAMTSAFDAMRPVLDALAGLAKRFAALDDGTKRIIIVFAAVVAAMEALYWWYWGRSPLALAR